MSACASLSGLPSSVTGGLRAAAKFSSASLVSPPVSGCSSQRVPVQWKKRPRSVLKRTWLLKRWVKARMRPSSVQSVMVAPSLVAVVGASATVVAVSGVCSPTAGTSAGSLAGASVVAGGGVGGAGWRAGRMSESFTVMGAFSPNPAAARARAAAVSSPAWLSNE